MKMVISQKGDADAPASGRGIWDTDTAWSWIKIPSIPPTPPYKRSGYLEGIPNHRLTSMGWVSGFVGTARSWLKPPRDRRGPLGGGIASPLGGSTAGWVGWVRLGS